MLPYLERFAASERATRLSNAALETLAVVAYRQPVSRGQVSEVRGVDSERALHTLERRGLAVTMVEDGAQAVERLEEALEAELSVARPEPDVLELAGDHLALGLGVGADVGDDQTTELAGVDELADAGRGAEFGYSR